jgi:hypothetical protein
VLVIRAVKGLYPDTVLLDRNADAVTNRSYGCAIERPFLFTVRMTGKPEVIDSSVGLVPTNALLVILFR